MGISTRVGLPLFLLERNHDNNLEYFANHVNSLIAHWKLRPKPEHFELRISVSVNLYRRQPSVWLETYLTIRMFLSLCNRNWLICLTMTLCSLHFNRTLKVASQTGTLRIAYICICESLSTPTICLARDVFDHQEVSVTLQHKLADMSHHDIMFAAHIWNIQITFSSNHVINILLKTKHAALTHLNPFKPEFTIAIFIHYKSRIAVAILDL